METANSSSHLDSDHNWRTMIYSHVSLTKLVHKAPLTSVKWQMRSTSSEESAKSLPEGKQVREGLC
jgi:hypothetical protein